MPTVPTASPSPKTIGEQVAGAHAIELRLREVSQLFNSLDPSPFNEQDLDHQMRLKCAFDPEHLLNPGKVFPQLRRCAELGRMHVHHGEMPFPDLPRF